MSECLDDELLLGFVERRLDLETTARVEDHIDACAACRRLLAMLAPTEAPSSGSEHASEGEDSVVEGYAMEEVIGEGAMGRVFAARDRQTGERVAVKVMRADARELVERFAREAAFMAQVSHPNVVGIRRVVEVGTGGTLALVMDLLEGRTLEDQLQEAPALSVAEAGRIGICLARAAGAAHAHGIIHRDIKPANVFLETASDGPARVRLLDFGLAKLFRVHPTASTLGRLTASGAVLGTPAYMAPEQVRGDSDIDPRADVWAVAAVIYRLLAGRAPVVGRGFADIFRRVGEPIAPVESLRPETPPAICRVIGRALAVDREARPADGNALASELSGVPATTSKMH